MTSTEPIDRAWLALEGLSLGDAFGQHVLRGPGAPAAIVRGRREPKGPWRYSDDTVMALSVFEILHTHGHIDQDALAHSFARRFTAEPDRGYGAIAVWILTRVAAGAPWRETAREPYKGTGSMGNGAAMRVAPIAGWFANDEREAVRAAIASAEVTHAHPEGQAGAAAAAAAGVFAWRARRDPSRATLTDGLRFVMQHTPPGATHDRLREAVKLGAVSSEKAASVLGDGSDVTAPDTVPFAIWAALGSLGRFSDALWLAMEGLVQPDADRDTIGAIVGGIAALSVGREGLPRAWLEAREKLPIERPTA